MAEKNKYSLIIIGAGPAGMTASIYASRFKVDNLIIGQSPGGLVLEAHKICNYPSEPEISGVELVTKMQQQVESLGASIVLDKVKEIKNTGKDEFYLQTESGKEFWTRTILLASGTEHRKLNLSGENEFLGKGVSYCATCDAMFYRDKNVAVIGGSDSANISSLYLSEVASKVYQIYRKDSLRGERAWIEQIKNNDKIEVIFNTEVKSLKGEEKLEKVVLDKPYQGKKELTVEGLFIEIGTVPQRELIYILGVKINKQGYVEVGQDQKTDQDRVWAAGDITNGSNNFRQIITACSEGAVAAENIYKYLIEKK